MAFRRFSRFRRRTTGRLSFGFRGPRLKDPQRTRRLERAEFYFRDLDQISNATEGQTRIFTHIASIALSLGNATPTSPEGRVGNVLSGMQRYIQINGLVFDYGYDVQTFLGDPPETDAGALTIQTAVVTDRLIPSQNGLDVLPASLNVWSPYQTQFPTAVLSTATPGALSDQIRQPTRVHWQRTERLFRNVPEVQSDLESTLYIGYGIRTRNQAPTFNRRLRVRLDDEHGLFLTTHYINDAAQTGIPQFIVRWARGTLFYRFVD